jgi:hypothetical protein
MTKSDGMTPTERYLAALGRRSFLSLWSHPNLYREPGKELADLTVVCGQHVILFSDKLVRFDQAIDVNIAWQRWYNRAILHSTKQLMRAKGWIERRSDKIFFDAGGQRSAKLFERVDGPLEVHLVAVANGASRACLNFFSGGSGSLIVCPEECPDQPQPFCVGNPAGKRAFVHVFDEANLNVVLQELDTIGDFLIYLRARERLFFSEISVNSHSEEDLLSHFLRNVNEMGEHDFIFDSPDDANQTTHYVIEQGYYLDYTNRSEYKRKKKADKISYFWDSLIESFARNLRNGTLVPVPEDFIGNDGRDGSAEIGLRYMALQPRIMRRAHSEAIIGAFDSLRKSRGDRYFRAMLPTPNDADKTGFFILLLNRKGPLSGWTYEEYRRYRAMIAHAYSENLLQRNRELKRVVGIATEGELGGRRSEDLIFQEQITWSDEALEQASVLAERFDIFKKGFERQYSAEEYPKTDLGLHGGFSPVPYQFFEGPKVRAEGRSAVGNRAQRRKKAAKLRRSGKVKRK